MKSYSAVLVRAYNEPYLPLFAQYYLAEGIDHVFVVADRWSLHHQALERVKKLDGVTVISMAMRSTRSPSQCAMDELTRLRDFRWILSVDADEYIITRDPKLTIAQALRQYNDVDQIAVPWMGMGFENRAQNPPNILQTLAFRLDHDQARQPLPLVRDDAFSKHKDGYFISLPKSVVNPNIDWQWDCHSPWSSASYTVRDSVIGLTTTCRGQAFVPWWMYRPNVPFQKRALSIFDAQSLESINHDKRLRSAWGVNRAALQLFVHEPDDTDGRVGWLTETALAHADMIVCHYRFTSQESVAEKCRSAKHFGTYHHTNGYHAQLNLADVDASEIAEHRVQQRLQEKRHASTRNMRLQSENCAGNAAMVVS